MVVGTKVRFSPTARTEGRLTGAGRPADPRISRLTNTEISRHQQHGADEPGRLLLERARAFLTCGNGAVKILDLETMEPIHTLRAHTSSCYSLELSPDGPPPCRRAVRRAAHAVGHVGLAVPALAGARHAADAHAQLLVVRRLTSPPAARTTSGSRSPTSTPGLYVHTVDTSPRRRRSVRGASRDYSLSVLDQRADRRAAHRQRRELGLGRAVQLQTRREWPWADGYPV